MPPTQHTRQCPKYSSAFGYQYSALFCLGMKDLFVEVMIPQRVVDQIVRYVLRLCCCKVGFIVCVVWGGRQSEHNAIL